MLFYVTKWVTARGILVLEGSKPESRGNSKKFWTTVRGAGRRMAILNVGREAFLTLEEAQADAQQRFKERHQKALDEYARTQSAMTALKLKQPILVHTRPGDLTKCKPFT